MSLQFIVTRVLLNMDKTRRSKPGCAQPNARTLPGRRPGRRPARAGTVHDCKFKHSNAHCARRRNWVKYIYIQNVTVGSLNLYSSSTVVGLHYAGVNDETRRGEPVTFFSWTVRYPTIIQVCPIWSYVLTPDAPSLQVMTVSLQ